MEETDKYTEFDEATGIRYFEQCTPPCNNIRLHALKEICGTMYMICVDYDQNKTSREDILREMETDIRIRQTAEARRNDETPFA